MTTATETTTTTWTIDSVHSIVEFAVKHLVVTTVKGRFRSVEASLTIDEGSPENSSVTTTIDSASVDTNDPDRDAHLRSDDFLNSAKYPKIAFQSTQVERVSDKEYLVHGNLTIRDVTRPVVLHTEFEGEVQDPWGNRRAAFTATTKISRKEFNARWNQLMAAGGAVVADEVKITLNIEAVQQK